MVGGEWKKRHFYIPKTHSPRYRRSHARVESTLPPLPPLLPFPPASDVRKIVRAQKGEKCTQRGEYKRIACKGVKDDSGLSPQSDSPDTPNHHHRHPLAFLRVLLVTPSLLPSLLPCFLGEVGITLCLAGSDWSASTLPLRLSGLRDIANFAGWSQWG